MDVSEQSPRPSSGLWWLKSSNVKNAETPKADITISPYEISSSMADFLEKERACQNSAAGGDATDADIGSIIEEINRLQAESPGGKPDDVGGGDRSVEDILKEAEKLVEESSKSFEQLSSRSSGSSRSRSTSLITPRSSKMTPRSPRSAKSTPRSPRNPIQINSTKLSYDSDDFESELSSGSKNRFNKEIKKKSSSKHDFDKPDVNKNIELIRNTILIRKIPDSKSSQNRSKVDDILNNDAGLTEITSQEKVLDENIISGFVNEIVVKSLENDKSNSLQINEPKDISQKNANNNYIPDSTLVDKNDSNSLEMRQFEYENLQTEMREKDLLLNEYERDNKRLLEEIKVIKDELETTKNKLKSPLTSSPKTELALQLELDNALENLKDFKEHNTALQLQLDTLNSSHQTLKLCNEELVNSNRTLERKVAESELIISRLKNELKSIQNKYNALLEQETVLKKSVEVERLQNKSLKLQNEKDAKCIQDLTRQVREMERIIARKHPDSVSALIVTANANMDQNARKILEDRIKQLESEARSRETHSSKLFTDVQEKFNTMKLKYESHIEDLEHHVADLKLQLSSKVSPELIENWTQTFFDENRNVHSNDIGVQTINQNTKVSKPIQTRRPEKNLKEDAHLLATIRGLNLEIANKEKVMFKLQREMDELRKTNKKLQKEREGTLKSNLIERMREVKCYNPDEYKLQYDKEADLDNMNQQVSAIREERDKLKIQLCRLEDDYEALKLKRLQDLNTLQEAHEQELTNYMAKMSPLREQLEVQQVTINKLQSQLASAREQITVLIVERDHLESRLSALRQLERENTGGESDKSEYAILRKKISQLERRYEDRELRLRAIVHGLAQKQAFSNRDCQQCLLRQQQLCGYKAELDQVLLTLRNHTKL